MALTKTTVDGLKYDPNGPSTQIYYPEGDVPGFGVRLFPSGTKSFVVWYRHNGKARLITLGKVGVLAVQQARELARERLVEVAKGNDPVEAERKAREKAQQAKTVKDLAAKYIEAYASVEKRSWKEDQRVLNSYILPSIGKMAVNDVRRPDVVKVVERVRRRSKAEANKVIALVTTMFNRAVTDWGWRDEALANPGKIKKHKIKPRTRRVKTHELPHLLNAIEEEGFYLRAYLLLLLLTGCRRMELLKVQWPDVDLHGREITLRAENTKANKSRIVYLSALAVETLRHLPRELRNPYIFPSSRMPKPGRGEASKEPRHIKEPQKAWERVRARMWLRMNQDRAEALQVQAEAEVMRLPKHAERSPAAIDARLLALAGGAMRDDGMDLLTLHDIRRTVAGMMADAGESEPVFAAVLGHAPTGVTAKHYAAPSSEAVRAAVERHGKAIQDAMAEASDTTREQSA